MKDTKSKGGWNKFFNSSIEMSMAFADILCESPIEKKLVTNLIHGLNQGNYFTIIPPVDMFTKKLEEADETERILFNLYEEADFWVLPNYPYENLRPDVSIVDLRKKKRKITLIECDSFQFHSSSEQLEKEKQRERKLMKLGYPILRFSGREITRTPTKVAIEIIKFLLKLE